MFPGAKPDLTDFSSPDVDPWGPGLWEEWLDFLEAHPQAGDSLDILDDVAAAMYEEELRMPDSLHGTLIGPLAERGHAIVVRALGGEAVTLPWLWLENRPGLRLTAQLIDVCLDQRDRRRATDLMQWMLRVNPHDNHGYRLVLVNELLHQERNAEALALIAAYPGDMHTETAYGEVLAHLRARDEDKARAALERALHSNRHVPEFLCVDRVQEPKLLSHGVTFGGKDQAWFYREDARDLWLATPGSLDWLERTANALRQEQPGLSHQSAGRRKGRRR
jgi:hypothetical protein